MTTQDARLRGGEVAVARPELGYLAASTIARQSGINKPDLLHAFLAGFFQARHHQRLARERVDLRLITNDREED